MKAAEDKNAEWQNAYNNKAAQNNDLRNKLAQYETNNGGGNPAGGGNPGGEGFSTDQSTRNIVREEIGLATKNSQKEATRVALQGHLKQAYKPSASNVQMDQLVVLIDSDAERWLDDPNFKAEYGHLTVQNQLVQAYDLASAGRLVQLVDTGKKADPPSPDPKNVQSQSGYGGPTNGTLTDGEILAQKEQELAALKAASKEGKSIDQNKLMSLEFQIQGIRKRQAGYS